MFRQIRYQTGEVKEIINEMTAGNIPLMDVDDIDDMNRFLIELSKHNINVIKELPYDRDAHDRVKEPEFEFRVAFSETGKNDSNVMYIDFYFEPEIEKDYDSIFGD